MKKSTVAPLLACLLLSPLAFTSCTDDHYDLNEVDSTIGVGSDGLRLPTSSTDEIQLSDVLELNESDVVKIQENGDYMFEQDGGDVTPARPMIDIIQISKQSTTSEALVIPKNLITGINAMGKKTGVRKADNIGKEAPVNHFDFSGNQPAEVLSLKTVSVDANIKLAVSFSSALKSCVTKIAKLSLNMPSYMSFTASTTSGDLSVNGHKITLANISTANEITLNIDINALDFNSGNNGNNGTLAIEGGKIKMDGTVVMGVEISPSDINLSGLTSGDLSITSQIQFPDFKVTGAQGRFSPTIDLGNLGEATINNVPDFLKNGNVVVDLANPQIWLTTNSDLTLAGYVDGVIKAYKKGQVIASVNVNGINIQANATSKICICRNASLVDGSMFTQVIEVPTLSTLIRTIPDKLVFEADARADSQNEYAITFGRQYNISPSYTIKAPIAFAEDARIVYNDSIEDMNKDLKDLDFAEGTYINVDANVENKVPAHLTVSAYAVDVNGKRMSDDLISIVVSNVVAASPDGTTPVVTPLNVKVQQNKPGVLKNVDKLMFTIEGSAKENGNTVEGVTLNANKHTLVARDIVVKVVGKMIIE